MPRDPYASIATRDPYASLVQRGPASAAASPAPASAAPTPQATPQMNREGLYQMLDPSTGKAAGIPYSKVGDAQNQGFRFADDNGRVQWRKDRLAEAKNLPWYSQERFDKTSQTFPDDRTAERLITKATGAGAYPFFHPLKTLKGLAEIGSKGNPQGFMESFQHPEENSIGQRGFQAIDEGKKFGPGYALSNLGAEGVGSYAGGKLIEPIAAVPKMAAPAGLRILGNVLESNGIERMNRFLNNNEKLPLNRRGELAWQTNPGKAVLESGPGTSMAASRRGMIPKVNTASREVGRSIKPIALASPAQVGTAPLWDSVNRVVDPMIQDAMGPLGNEPLATNLEDMRQTFTPTFARRNGLPVSEVLDLKRQMDRNINNMGGFQAPGTAPLRQAAKDIRAGIKNNLYDAEPELREPSERYEALADASDRLTKGQKNPRKGPVTARDAGRLLSHGARSTALGAGAGYYTHNPLIGTAVGVGAEVLPRVWRSPVVQTGMATGEYQLGAAANRMSARIPPIRTDLFGPAAPFALRPLLPPPPDEREGLGQSMALKRQQKGKGPWK